MNIYALVPMVAFLVSFFVWAFVLGQRQRNPLNTSFLLLTAVGCGWIVIELLFYLPFMAGLEDAILRATVPLWASTGVLFLNFGYRLSGRRHDAVFWVFLTATVAVIVVDLSTNLILNGHVRHPWGVADVRNPVAHTLACVPPVAASLFGLWLVFDYRRSVRDPGAKTAAALVLLGGAITLGAVATLNIVLPNFLGLLDTPRFGSSAMSVFIVVILRAVTKHNFLSISVEQVAEELFEDVRDGIALVDRAGKIRRMNRAARELLDLDDRASIGSPAVDLLPGYQANEDFANRVIETEQKDVRRVLAISLSTNTKQGIDLGKILIVRDITAAKRAEDLLRRSRDELEVEVERRTEELRHAQKMEAVGTLAGGIAHDFNNLLAAIMGFATAARDDLPPGHEVRADLDEILLAARRARDIVQQLLTFSRRDEPASKSVAVTAVIDEALKLLEVSLPATITIDKQIDIADGNVIGDPSHLHQVVMNLCTNAYHAMRETGGRLSIRLENVTLEQELTSSHPPLEPGRYVVTTVSDTGCGIRKEFIDRIFDPFFTTKADGAGTGLGLATVQRIITDHEGAIEVSSEEQVGSTFSVYLPWSAAGPDLEDSTRFAVEGGTERVMFVDDKDQVARAGRRLLEPLGYRVETFTSPAEALEVFRGDPRHFDLVITDFSMPEMNGLELAGEMLRMRPGLPTLLVSGKGDATLNDRARALGVTAFLHKPLSKATLAHAIRAALET